MTRRLFSFFERFEGDEAASLEKLSIISAFALFTVAGLVIVYAHDAARIVSLLWAGACLAAGFLLGFLFGIPRTLQTEQALPAGDSGYGQRVNTNLESISDWLTKILVGLGLTQLRQLGIQLDKAASYIAAGIGNSPEQRVFSSASILYFAIVGFIGGYLLTRLFLAPAFRKVEDPGQNLARIMAGKSPSLGIPGKSRQAVETISAVLSAFRDLETKAPAEKLRGHIEQLESFEKDMPLSRELFIVLGRLYRSLGEYREAIDVLDRFIRNKQASNASLDTDTASALYNRACYATLLAASTTAGQPTEVTRQALKAQALNDLREAISILPDIKADAATDPDLEGLRDEPGFKSLVGDPKAPAAN